MSATDTKEATAAMSQTIDEVCQEAMSCYEKRGKEFVETFNRMSNQTIDLFEKTLGVYEATSVPDAQRRVEDLIESSLSALRVNVDSVLNMNAKIIASWKELARIVSPRGPIRRKSTSPAASGRRGVNPSPEPGVLGTPPEPLQHHPSQPENRMSASTDASSTPNPARYQDARRRCRNHWKRQAEVRRSPPKRRAPDRDWGGAKP